MSKVLNSTPRAAVHVPTTIYKMKKMAVPKLQSTLHIRCNKCFNYVSSIRSEAECEACDKQVKAIDSDYFSYIPIKQQLLNAPYENIDEIIEYASVVSKKNEITDVHNSKVFQNAQEKYPSHIILPLIINTDGAKAFKSSSKSLWLIQAYQCYLPPQKRFALKNILLLAVHFGKEKISMNDFFFHY